jgi:hypothetical protein
VRVSDVSVISRLEELMEHVQLIERKMTAENDSLTPAARGKKALDVCPGVPFKRFVTEQKPAILLVY